MLFSGVRVGKGAVVKDSVVFPNCVIKEDAKVEYTIIDYDVVVEKEAKIGGSKEENEGKITVIAEKNTIGKGALVEPGAVIEADVQPAEEEV